LAAQHPKLDGDTSTSVSYPVFELLGLNSITSQITDIYDKLEEIFLDMVGEATFITSIAEINAAIEAAVLELSGAISVAAGLVVTSTTATTAAVVSGINSVTNFLTTMVNWLTSIDSRVSTIDVKLSNILLNTDNIDQGVFVIKDTLQQLLSNIDASSAITNSLLQNIRDDVAVIRTTTNTQNVNLTALTNNTAATNILLGNLQSYIDTQQPATLGQVIFDLNNNMQVVTAVMELSHPVGANYINVKQV